MVNSPASVTASAGIISENDFALAGFFAAAAGSFAGLDAVFTIAVAFALAAAFLNAAFNFCLGCEIYLLLLRARSK